ncbi:hypothetical protein G6F36_014662 [Rhizopus arrhizus]|nr:hypothetical protein G6F36_014662 [Rhizopus arrhizus]
MQVANISGYLKQNVHKNHVNKHFWDHEIQHFSQINSNEMLIEKELEVLEKMTAIAALRSYNQKSKASSSTTPTEEESRSSITQSEEESSGSSIHINENRSSYAPKRKQEEDKEITTTPTKRPNQQQTLSEKFRVYKQKVMHDAARGADFSLETNVSELI